MRINGVLEKEVTLRAPLVVDGQGYTTVVIREAIGLDSEAASSKAIANNIGRVYNEIVRRCIVEVPGATREPSLKEIQDAPMFVVDDLIEEIRKLTMGDAVEIHMKCEGDGCKATIDEIFSIDELELGEGPTENMTFTLTRGFNKDGKALKNIILRPMNGHDREILMNGSAEDVVRKVTSTDMIHRCIISVDGVKVTKDDVNNLPNVDRKAILDKMSKSPARSIIYRGTCRACNREYVYAWSKLDFLV